LAVIHGSGTPAFRPFRPRLIVSPARVRALDGTELGHPLGKKQLARFVAERPARFLASLWIHNPPPIRALLRAILRGLKCAEKVLLTLQPPPRDAVASDGCSALGPSSEMSQAPVH
jgi:hypothetical protein